METSLKRLNTIYCGKLRKKSVSPVLENKTSQFLPLHKRCDGCKLRTCNLTQQDWVFWEGILEISGRLFQRCLKQRQCQRNNNLL